MAKALTPLTSKNPPLSQWERGTFIKLLLVVVSCLLSVVSYLGCGDAPGSLTSLSISPTSATVGVNQSKTFTVYGHNSVGQIVTVTPTWSVSGGIGALESNGSSCLLMTGSSAGTGMVIASAEGLTTCATVTVTSTGWITGIISSTTGQLLSGIQVLIQGTALETYSESGGVYSISNVPAGTYRVYTSSSYYNSASSEATLAAGESKIVNLVLTPYNDITLPTVPSF